VKILIIGIFRTGSTSLLYNISKQGYKPIFEPYNKNHFVNMKYKYPLSELNLYENLVVKSLTDQVHTDGINSVDMYVEFSRYFDNVILLSRRNREDHFISFLNSLYQIKNGKSSHLKYELNEKKIYNFHSNDFINECKIHINKQYEILNSISSILNIPITFYEDLYSINTELSYKILKNIIPDNIDISQLLKYLDVKNKYRITNRTII
jgi:hypothetical protein